MVCDRNTPQSQGDDLLCPCEFADQSETQSVVDEAIHDVTYKIQGKVTTARNNCKNMSQHLTRPVCWGFRDDDSPQGVFACLLWETLHLCYLGIMKHLLNALCNFREAPHLFKEWCSCRHHSGSSQEPPDEEMGLSSLS